jgi:hypothetical protein
LRRQQGERLFQSLLKSGGAFTDAAQGEKQQTPLSEAHHHDLGRGRTETQELVEGLP